MACSSRPNKSAVETIGWLIGSPLAGDLPPPARYLAAIFRAPFRSALSRKPHCRHQKSLWERRLLRAVCPQQLHLCEVCRGSTATTVQPRSSALYAMKPFNWANDQECMRRLVVVLRRAFVRFLMFVRFSRTIVLPGSTDWTICLLRT